MVVQTILVPGALQTIPDFDQILRPQELLLLLLLLTSSYPPPIYIAPYKLT